MSDDPKECRCVECEARRSVDAAIARSPEATAAHVAVEGKRFADLWANDWGPLITDIATRTGLSMAEVIAYLGFLQLHQGKTAILRLVKGSEAMWQWAQKQHGGDDEEWKQP